jgi:hypothetical protein
MPATAYLVGFNQTIAMLGFVFQNIEKVRIPEGAILLKPFVALH